MDRQKNTRPSQPRVPHKKKLLIAMNITCKQVFGNSPAFRFRKNSYYGNSYHNPISGQSSQISVNLALYVGGVR